MLTAIRAGLCRVRRVFGDLKSWPDFLHSLNLPSSTIWLRNSARRIGLQSVSCCISTMEDAFDYGKHTQRTARLISMTEHPSRWARLKCMTARLGCCCLTLLAAGTLHHDHGLVVTIYSKLVPPPSWLHESFFSPRPAEHINKLDFRIEPTSRGDLAAWLSSIASISRCLQLVTAPFLHLRSQFGEFDNFPTEKTPSWYAKTRALWSTRLTRDD